MRHLSLLVLAITLLSACSNPTDYTINGEFEKSWDGQKVILYAFSETRNMVGMDSTEIKDGTFELKGNADSIGWYILVVENGMSQPFMKDFYLGGKMNCTYDDGRIKISGSDINNKYQDFEDKYVAMSKKVAALNQKLQASPDDKELIASMNKAYEEYLKSFGELTKTTIRENMDNPLGFHIFEAAISSISNDVVEEIIKGANKEFLEKPLVKMISEQLELAKKVDKGNKGPNLTMKTPESKEVSLFDYIGKGNYVLIDFWASWCGPCIQEMPNVVAAYTKYHPKGFEIVGVSLDEDAASWKEAIKKNKMIWPQMSDLAGWKSQAVTIYSFSAIPHTVLIDPKGVIVENGLRGDALIAKLKEIYE